jgi:hypothetical protein
MTSCQNWTGLPPAGGEGLAADASSVDLISRELVLYCG